MLILASQSPRRRELLELAQLEFECMPSSADETVPPGMPAEKLPEYLARLKAADILKERPDDIVLGSDTIVAVGGDILGKPKDQEDAFRMLRRLSGKTHQVYTGVAILGREKEDTFTTVTDVEFYELSDQEILDYIKSGEPMDKAGAYGIQGRGALFVKAIRGDYYTVMGLPIAEVVRHLKKSEDK